MLYHKIFKLRNLLKKDNVLLVLVAAAFLGGIFGSLIFSAPKTQANIFNDVYNNILKGFGLPKNETQQDVIQEEEPVKSIIDSIIPPKEEKVIYVDTHEQAVVATVEKASPAVVSIIVSKDLPVIEKCPYDPFSNLPEEFQQFFNLNNRTQFYQNCQKGTQKKEVGGGSGFFVSSNGLIITNKHVVSDTKAEYTVLTNDGKKYSATVLDRHPSLDIAIIKITGGNFPTIKFGDSSKIKLGQTAIAIGNALGEFRNTVSVGIVSGLARSVIAQDGQGQSETIENVIQTDAAINPGNSGGPLLNSKGEVIGINVAMVSGAQSIGFSIPINSAKKSIESVGISGKIKVAFLGIRYVITDQGALLKGNENSSAVESESPAQKAGLVEGDVILEMDGQKVDKDHSPSYLISQKNSGDTILVKILRQEKEMTLSVTLGERK